MDDVLLKNARIFDGVRPDLVDGDLLVTDGRIAEVSDTRLPSRNARVIDLHGRVLMPGLIDAHVHAYFPDVDSAKVERMPMTLVAHHARIMLEKSFARGFTTVRDAGGADVGLHLAVERGWIRGPRVFFCGRSLSQTGGHGDKRHPHETEFCACGMAGSEHSGFTGHRTRVVDGVENMRLAVREELRHGAHFIKLMGSGGVASPSDPIHLCQYSDDEIRAVVDEVERHDKYVTAHCHPDGAIRRCIELGVHGIEHGTLISRETAELAAKAGTTVVPTLSVIKALAVHGHALGLAEESQRKLREIEPEALYAVERLKAAGAVIGFGTDLIGSLEQYQCMEFQLRKELFTPAEILRSATSVNAKILRQENSLGRIAAGFVADVIAVDGDPLRDLSVFADDGRNIALIMKGGEVFKSTC